MDINYKLNTFELSITDKEMAEWLDGNKIYWDMPKDDRPDFNIYEYFDHVIHQPNYILDKLARELELNQVPAEVVDGLKNLNKLCDIVEKYQLHILGLILKERNNHD